jgi:L-lactate dehydrogenase complex protein LldG
MLEKEVERLKREVERNFDHYLNMLIEALKRNSVDFVISEDPGEADFKSALVSKAASVAADTGVVFFSGSELKRRSALAEHHVAILTKDRIMPDIISAYKLALLSGREIFATSSASKTADIEGKVVWGMHGPRKFTVVLRGWK